MKNKTYVWLCGGLTLVWVLGLLFIQPLAEFVEQRMMDFLQAAG